MTNQQKFDIYRTRLSPETMVLAKTGRVVARRFVKGSEKRFGLRILPARMYSPRGKKAPPYITGVPLRSLFDVLVDLGVKPEHAEAAVRYGAPRVVADYIGA